MSTIRKLFFGFTAFLLLAGLLGFTAVPALAATCTKYHTVKRGEYLVQIGRLYGVSWRTLVELNDLDNPSLIFPGQKLCVATDDDSAPPSTPIKIPTFTISSVVHNQSVTIRTANFPANDTFDVLMGAFGTQGIGGKKVDAIRSGRGGSFTATFKIPASLRGSERIAIRLQSPTSGYFSYNWFWNSTSGSTTPPSDSGVIPTFSIVNVVRDKTVTIRTANFPADMTFTVRMGAFGTKGIGGTEVARFDSGDGGSFNKTFDIPAGLRGSNRIAIRTDSTSSGHFSYNWFWNNTTP